MTDFQFLLAAGRTNTLLLLQLSWPFSTRVVCASVLRTKRAAGRPNDLEAIAELEAIQEEHGS